MLGKSKIHEILRCLLTYNLLISLNIVDLNRNFFLYTAFRTDEFELGVGDKAQFRFCSTSTVIKLEPEFVGVERALRCVCGGVCVCAWVRARRGHKKYLCDQEYLFTYKKFVKLQLSCSKFIIIRRRSNTVRQSFLTLAVLSIGPNISIIAWLAFCFGRYLTLIVRLSRFYRHVT